MLTHELAASTFRYDPNTGAVYLIGKDTPITTKTKSGNAIRCQIQTANTYKDTTAHAVAWVLLTGQDLHKDHKPKHINGDTFDNRAHNLYLAIEKKDPFSWWKIVLPDTPLARHLYPNGGKTGDTWIDETSCIQPVWSDTNDATNRYLTQRRDLDKIDWTAPVDLDHFTAWVIANCDPRTSAQRLADLQAGQIARELALIDKTPEQWVSWVAGLIAQNGATKNAATYNAIDNMRQLHTKLGRTLPGVLRHAPTVRSQLDHWKEKQKIYVL